MPPVDLAISAKGAAFLLAPNSPAIPAIKPPPFSVLPPTDPNSFKTP